MPLFHPRVLQRELKKSGPMPEHHGQILRTWSKNLAAGNYDVETQDDAEFIQRILVDILGYVGSSADSAWTVAKNQPVGTGNVDVALGTFSSNEPPSIIAPFELKGAKTKDLDVIMPGRNKSPVQQAWEYAMDAKGAKWVLVSNYRQIRLYAVGYGRKDFEVFDLATMSNSHNYARFHLLLSADNLLYGYTLNLLRDSGEVEKDITKKLYAEYKTLRALLLSEIIASNAKIDPMNALAIGQTILDRVLFVAFSEDKGLLKKNTLKDAYEHQNPYNPQPIWENFKGLFNAINSGNTKLNIPGYNGGLFAENPTINGLDLSDNVCKRFVDIGEYDFDSDVSVNILGHIFEQSVVDIEEMKKELDPSQNADEISSKRRTDGIFYTPPFITRHIVEEAVGKWLFEKKKILGFDTLDPLTDKDFASIKVISKGKSSGKVVFNAKVKLHVSIWEGYRDALSNIKVVDPACGSGAFLNEVFDYLYREGQTINQALEALYGGQINLFKWDTHILANNIFGVDINRESVEITKLSLWLKTANRNEKLSYLDDNIKTGNSLIDDCDIVGGLAFNWKEQFPDILENGGFDIVLGNPPYVDSEAMTKAWPREREYLTKHFKQTRGNWDLYIAFLELGCNLLSETGYLSFITPDKWISKDFGSEIRKRVLPGLVSLLPAGRDVFESALVDSLVTTVSGKPVGRLQIQETMNGEVVVAAEIAKSEVNSEEGFDQLLSPHFRVLQKLERSTPLRLADIAEAESACATSDTYELGKFLSDADSRHGYDPKKHYRVANTGTLSRYVFRWGLSPMRYLKKDYLFPIVDKSVFNANFGATYKRRAASPKLVIKGLTLLDAAIDLNASYVPGKSTIVVTNDDLDTLKVVAAFLNSPLASFYVKQKYASASYNGGVSFTPEMINSIPFPEKLNRKEVVRGVDEVLKHLVSIADATYGINAAIRANGVAGKLGRKLEHWFLLTGAEFAEEVQRLGVDMTVQKRSEWADMLDKNKATISHAIARLRVVEKGLSDIIYEAFGLSEQERAGIAKWGTKG